MTEAAVLWDVDGTLVDTAEMHFAAWLRLADAIGQPFSRADFAATFGQRNPEIIRRLFEPHADADRIAELGERKEVYYRDSVRQQGVALLPGVSELLRGLREAGWRQAIASSAPRANVDLILDRTGSADYFSAVVTAEDTQRGKPDPQVFQIAAERLGVPARQCVVLEDAVAGVQAAKAAGMACVAVRFVGHHAEDALRTAGADRVVACLSEVDANALRHLLTTDRSAE